MGNSSCWTCTIIFFFYPLVAWIFNDVPFLFGICLQEVWGPHRLVELWVDFVFSLVHEWGLTWLDMVKRRGGQSTNKEILKRKINDIDHCFETNHEGAWNTLLMVIRIYFLGARTEQLPPSFCVGWNQFSAEHVGPKRIRIWYQTDESHQDVQWKVIVGAFFHCSIFLFKGTILQCQRPTRRVGEARPRLQPQFVPDSSGGRMPVPSGVESPQNKRMSWVGNWSEETFEKLGPKYNGSAGRMRLCDLEQAVKGC